MIQRDRLVEQFLKLVQIDSESGFEQEISRELQVIFRQLGLHVIEDDTAILTGHGSGNLCCTLAANSENKDILPIFFTCHMDTVAPGKGIKPRIGEDGIIRSDGTTILASDDKAGIAALIEAIQVIQEQQMMHGLIQLVITVGEEAGLKGARAMHRDQIKAELGYALDSNGEIGHIVTVAPGRAEISITFFGKSAHGGVNPEDGISAIQIASKAVSRMPLGRIDADTTANIGSFSGIGPLNVVCDKVVIKAEARSVSAQKLEAQIEAMRQSCKEATLHLGTTFEFSSQVLYHAYHHSDTAPVVQLAIGAIASLGLSAVTCHSGGGSDAHIFNGLGIPTVNLAIGYRDIHTVREHIAVSDLIKATELVVAIVQSAAKSVLHV